MLVLFNATEFWRLDLDFLSDYFFTLEAESSAVVEAPSEAPTVKSLTTTTKTTASPAIDETTSFTKMESKCGLYCQLQD